MRSIAVMLALACATAAQASTMAVLPLRAEGLQLNDAKRLNLLVRARAASRGGHAVQSEDLTTDLVEASQSLGIDCDVNAVQCGAELGKIADVELVLLGRATSLDDDGARSVGLTLRVVDVREKRELRRVTALIPAAADRQADAMDAVATSLFDAGAPLMSLAVVCDQADASVLVDGQPFGTTPMAAPIDGLAPARHVLRVEKRGYLPVTRTVDLAGGPAQVEVPLVVDPQSVHETVKETVRTETNPLAVVVPFVVAGVGVVAAAGGGVALAVGMGPYNRIGDNEEKLASLKKDAATDPAYPAKVKDVHADSEAALADWNAWGQAAVTSGVVLLAVGGLAALGGGAAGTYFLLSE